MTQTQGLRAKRTPTKRRSHRDYCDQLIRAHIKARDVTCQMAGDDFFGMDECEGGLQAAHFQPRDCYATRWTPDNLALLCAHHHHLLDRNEFTKWDWIRARLGGERYEDLGILVDAGWDKDYSAVLARIKALEVP